MTRKDYILLAEALRLSRENGESPESEIAAMLKRDNSRFDREHFLAVVRGERELQSRPPRKAA